MHSFFIVQKVSELAIDLLYFTVMVATHKQTISIFRLFSSEATELLAHFYANLRMILGKTHA